MVAGVWLWGGMHGDQGACVAAGGATTRYGQ